MNPLAGLLGYYLSVWDADNTSEQTGVESWTYSEFQNLYEFQIPHALRQLLAAGWDTDTILIEYRDPVTREVQPVPDEDKYWKIVNYAPEPAQHFRNDQQPDGRGDQCG